MEIMFQAGYLQTIRRTARFNAGVNVDLKVITPGLKLKTYNQPGCIQCIYPECK